MPSSRYRSFPPLGRAAGRPAEKIAKEISRAAGGAKLWPPTDSSLGTPEVDVVAELNARVWRLISDLADEDLSMAFLDLAQLQRVISAMSSETSAGIRREV